MRRIGNMKIGCVVVTYNKVELLKECISAILNQTLRVDKLFIVDNCSNDNTSNYVKNLIERHNNIYYYRLEKNIGGAGGFNYGLKKAYCSDVDYIWMMDNDTIPKNDALEKLCNYINKLKWGFLCSNVRWIDDKPCLMNIPSISIVWNEYVKEGLIKVESTSFVSLFINKKIIEEVGYPIKDFFIWGDDVEFTSRITTRSAGYMVIDSEVVHKMTLNQSTDLIKEDKSRLGRYFYAGRNTGYIVRKKGIIAFVKNIFRTIIMLYKIVGTRNQNKISKIGVVLKGFVFGLFFNPKIEQVSKKKY
ncbi:glycosyltransferase [Sporolactobacillus sp. THM7-4]|nr:glycosyltransferase [Sporolactobacillus sp. THM7-4]